MTDWAVQKHIVVTPLRSNSLQGLEVESECCQFGHRAMTTALSSISSDRPISTDASTDAQKRWRHTQEHKHRVQLGEALRQSLGKNFDIRLAHTHSRHARTHITSRQWRAPFIWCLLKHITNLGPQGERHLCFISVHVPFANGRVVPTKRKLKHQIPAIIRNIIIFSWCITSRTVTLGWGCNWVSWRRHKLRNIWLHCPK